MSNHNNDPLILKAAVIFNNELGDMQGAPYVLLHDVVDPNELINLALDLAATELNVELIKEGKAWLTLCNSVIDCYDTNFAISELLDEMDELF